MCKPIPSVAPVMRTVRLTELPRAAMLRLRAPTPVVIWRRHNNKYFIILNVATSGDASHVSALRRLGLSSLILSARAAMSVSGAAPLPKNWGFGGFTLPLRCVLWNVVAGRRGLRVVT